MSESARISLGGLRPRLVRLSFRSVVLGVAAVLAVFGLRNAFVAAHRVLTWAVASTAIAVLVEPLVNWLGKVIPRVAAVLLTFVLIAAAALGLVFGSVDNLDAEINSLKRQAPAVTAELEGRDDELGEVMRDLDLSARVDVFLETLDDRVGSGGGALAQNAPTAPIYFVNAILTIFLLVYGADIMRGALKIVPDDRRRIVVDAAVKNAVIRARRTVAAILGQAVVVGGAVWAFAVLADLPAPIVLGLVAAVGAMLPDFGILLGILPTLALTAGVQGARVAVLLLAVAFAAQMFEALWLRIRLDEWGVEIGPAIVWIVALLGFTIYGVGAVVFGVAYAIFIMGIVDQVPQARKLLDGDSDGGSNREVREAPPQ